MDEISEEDKKLAEQMAIEYAKRCKIHATKGKYDFGNPTKRTFSGSGSVTFSNSDTGNDADFFAPEKAEAALSDIRNLTIRESVKQTIKQYLESRNKAIRSGRERAKKSISFPFQYRQHSYKDD